MMNKIKGKIKEKKLYSRSRSKQVKKLKKLFRRDFIFD